MIECLVPYLNFPSYSNSATLPRSRLSLAMPLGRLLGDRRYKESSPGVIHVLELLLEETIRRLDVTTIEKESFRRFWPPNSYAFDS